MNPTRAIVVLLLFLSGCGGCQRTEESAGGAGGAAPKAPAASGAAAGATGKIQVAPLQATVAAHPAAAPQAGSGAAPGAPAPTEKNDDCIVVMDGNPDYGPPPLAVTFSAEAECTSGEPKFKWNFGDESGASTETNPSHSYAKPGDYTASVTVTGPSGATATDEIDITVEEEDAPQQ